MRFITIERTSVCVFIVDKRRCGGRPPIPRDVRTSLCREGRGRLRIANGAVGALLMGCGTSIKRRDSADIGPRRAEQPLAASSPGSGPDWTVGRTTFEMWLGPGVSPRSADQPGNLAEFCLQILGLWQLNIHGEIHSHAEVVAGSELRDKSGSETIPNFGGYGACKPKHRPLARRRGGRNVLGGIRFPALPELITVDNGPEFAGRVLDKCGLREGRSRPHADRKRLSVGREKRARSPRTLGRPGRSA